MKISINTTTIYKIVFNGIVTYVFYKVWATYSTSTVIDYIVKDLDVVAGTRTRVAFCTSAIIFYAGIVISKYGIV